MHKCTFISVIIYKSFGRLFQSSWFDIYRYIYWDMSCKTFPLWCWQSHLCTSKIQKYSKGKYPTLIWYFIICSYLTAIGRGSMMAKNTIISSKTAYTSPICPPCLRVKRHYHLVCIPFSPEAVLRVNTSLGGSGNCLTRDGMHPARTCVPPSFGTRIRPVCNVYLKRARRWLKQWVKSSHAMPCVMISLVGMLKTI